MEMYLHASFEEVLIAFPVLSGRPLPLLSVHQSGLVAQCCFFSKAQIFTQCVLKKMSNKRLKHLCIQTTAGVLPKALLIRF